MWTEKDTEWLFVRVYERRLLRKYDLPYDLVKQGNFTKSLGHLLVLSGIRFRHSEVVLASDSWLQSERSERARNFEKMTSLHAFMENRNLDS